MIVCADFVDSIQAGENCPACGAPWEDHVGWAVDLALDRNINNLARAPRHHVK